MLCLKYVFFIINFLLFCCGVAAAAVGIWTLTDPAIIKTYVELPMDKLFIVSCVITVVGFVLVIVGFIGCCGVLLDNACCLCLFSTLMIILLIMGAAVAVVIWIAMKNDTFGNKLGDILFDQIEDHEFFNELQKKVECCGVRSSLDYTDKNKAIPSSCKDQYNVVFEQGCWPKIKESLSKKANVLAGMSATLAALGIISTIVSLVILCTVRQAAKAI